MGEERKSFTVNDRRQFTSEGEPRREPAEEVVASAPEPPAEPKAEPAAAPAQDAADFGTFFISLAAQAGQALASEPGEGASEDRLPEARYLISILEMLKDKTDGRRTPHEDAIVAGVLYELRMGYLARTRAGQK